MPFYRTRVKARGMVGLNSELMAEDQIEGFHQVFNAMVPHSLPGHLGQLVEQRREVERQRRSAKYDAILRSSMASSE
jgi:hypothetical protein